jgi:hypothetical protein
MGKNPFEENDYVSFYISFETSRIDRKLYKYFGFVDETSSNRCRVVITQFQEETPIPLMEKYPVGSMIDCESDTLTFDRRTVYKSETALLLRDAALIVDDRETFYEYGEKANG